MTYPDGGSVVYDYDDPGNTVKSTTALSSSTNPCAGPANSQSDVVYDGLGRKKTTHLLTDPQGAVTTDTVYDAMGRVFKVSNPYRSGDTPVYTTTTYDGLGRLLLLVRPDISSIFYSSLANQTTVYELGCNVFPSNDCETNTSTRTLDSLGRLKSVLEANNKLTTYSYDPLGNLTDVIQGVQHRQFAYDSLGRLQTASNPESGFTSYAYDHNGNVLSVAQAGITRCFGIFDATNTCLSGYDKLNRPLYKSYYPVTNPATPTVAYQYDDGNMPNSIGHLTQVDNGVGTTKFLSFDAMGRSTSSSQTTGSVASGSFSYVYNLAGDLEKLVFPSGRSVTTCYDGANRIASVSGKATPSASATTYASGPTSAASIQYAPHGAISQMKLGNGLFEQSDFNVRLQTVGVNLGTSLSAKNDVWGIANHYNPDGIIYNNGNLLSQTITLPGVNQTISQVFLYDILNRIMLASEKPSTSIPACPDASSQWCEKFSYDDYGNRSMPQTSYTGLVVPQNFSTANNKILDAGYGYDPAGNLNQDPVALLTYKYDAENRLVASCANDTAANCTNQPGTGRTLYSYDGDGRRVTKRTPSGALTTYIYDASGELAAEYGTPGSTGGTEYLTADQLGSTRVITNTSGGVLSRHDFRPFGDEIPVTTGSPRQGVTGYGLDASIVQKFTGKERDLETGLDYFGARYMSSAQGRFTSVDPIWVTKERLVDPQRLNLYAYGRDNPLRFIDPEGMDVTLGRCAFGSRQECFEQVQAGLKKEDRQHVHLVQGDGKNGFKKGEFGITVDADYKSDSKNFQTLQTLAGDHTATAQIDVLKADEKFDVRVSLTMHRDAKSGLMVDGPLVRRDMTPGFDGYSFYPPGTGAPQPFSIGNFTDIVVNAGTGEVPETIYHELRHVLLGDFGRKAPYGAHGTGSVNSETTEAEKEASKNKAIR